MLFYLMADYKVLEVWEKEFKEKFLEYHGQKRFFVK
jgi:hypothetical protein